MDASVNALIELIRQHTEDDRENFKVVRSALEKIDTNVSSLMNTRAESKGASKVALWAAGILATLAGTALSTVIAWALRASH